MLPQSGAQLSTEANLRLLYYYIFIIVIIIIIIIIIIIMLLVIRTLISQPTLTMSLRLSGCGGEQTASFALAARLLTDSAS